MNTINTNTDPATHASANIAGVKPISSADKLRFKKSCIFDRIAIHSTADSLPAVANLIAAYESRIDRLKTKQSTLNRHDQDDLENFGALRNTIATLELHLAELQKLLLNTEPPEVPPTVEQPPAERLRPPQPNEPSEPTKFISPPPSGSNPDSQQLAGGSKVGPSESNAIPPESNPIPPESNPIPTDSEPPTLPPQGSTSSAQQPPEPSLNPDRPTPSPRFRALNQ